jgi:hypothetical protein
MDNQNPFLKGHPRYEQERRNGNQQQNGNVVLDNLLLRHPLIRRIQDNYKNAMDGMILDVNFQAPIGWGTEAVYLVTFAHIMQIIMNIPFGFSDYAYREPSIVLFIDSILHRRIMLGILRLIEPIFNLLNMFFGRANQMVWSFTSFIAVLFMLGNYIGFRYFFRIGRRNLRIRRQGGTKKRKGGNSKKKSSKKTQSKKSFTDTSLEMSDLHDLSTKTQTHISGKVKISNSKLDKETQNEMLLFIKKYITQVNDNKYKISLSGLDLIISIEDGKVTFDTEFSDKEKFDKISKEIFDKNKSVYAKYGVTEDDINNKIIEISNNKINFELIEMN